MEYMEGMEFIHSCLEEDEYVLWRGKLGKKNTFSSRDRAVLPFALFWTAFALLLEGSVIMSGAPLMYCIFGAPFVLIIKRDKDIEVYLPDELPPMKIELHKNGNGTIIFSKETYSRRRSTYYTCCMLEDLPDIAQAQNAINIMKGKE